MVGAYIRKFWPHHDAWRVLIITLASSSVPVEQYTRARSVQYNNCFVCAYASGDVCVLFSVCAHLIIVFLQSTRAHPRTRCLHINYANGQAKITGILQFEYCARRCRHYLIELYALHVALARTRVPRVKPHFRLTDICVDTTYNTRALQHTLN